MLSELRKTIARHDKLGTFERDRNRISILMNDKRQKILQYIFKFPCSHLHGIARNLGFSINATRWHLNKLISGGYISEHYFSNRKIFFPNNCLNEPDIKLLGIMNGNKNEIIYNEIKNNPGITQKDLINTLNKKQSTLVDNLNILEESNLIYSQKDGIFRRYYPTTLLKTRERVNRKPMKEYRGYLLQILRRDGVEPEILRTTDKKFHIRIKSGKSNSDLVFHFNPYERFI